jgi:MFS family permease
VHLEEGACSWLADTLVSELGPATPTLGYRGLLRNREYVGLLLSSVVSLVGDQLSRVALTVLVFERTNSPLLSAITYAATFLPVVIGAPLLGGLADRLPRRRLLIAADVIRAGLLALMALPGMPIWVLLTLLMLAVTVQAPYNAARSPLLRDILGDDDAYQLGTSVDETVEQSGYIAGFAAAGALLAVFTPSTALLIDAISFVGSAIVTRLLVRDRPPADSPAEHSSEAQGTAVRRLGRLRRGANDARIGFRAAMAPACRRPLLLTWSALSLTIAPEALAVPWGHQLGAGTLGIGLLFAAYPAGAVAGLLMAGRVSVERGQRLLLPLAVLSLLPLLFAALAPSLGWALLLVFISGVGTAYSMLARVAFVRGVANAQRGRAFAIASAGVTAGQGLGIALAGGIAALTNPSTSITISAIIGLVLVTFALVASPPPTTTVEAEVPIEATTPWPGDISLPPEHLLAPIDTTSARQAKD